MTNIAPSGWMTQTCVTPLSIPSPQIFFNYAGHPVLLTLEDEPNFQ
jgi:hypothetical protein